MPVKVGLKYIDKWKESMEDEILAYEQEEIEKGQIVFYGPSNFTRWSARWNNTPLSEALLGASGKKCCINRGFGSSTTEHHLYYYPRAIRPLEPKVLVYSTGFGNTIPFGYTPEEIQDLTERLLSYVREDFPEIKIYFCGINIYRTKLFNSQNSERIAREESFEAWIRAYTERTPNCKYIDVSAYEPLQRDDIYVEDKVHFNSEGYRIYAELFKEALKDELNEF